MNPLWIAQIRGMLGLELRKNLLSMRAMPLYLLAATPLLATGLFIVVSSLAGTPDDTKGPVGASNFFAYFFQFVLNVPVFFGCAWIFMNLFRGEVLDRSLHYYFLSPVRRDVLVAGKYVSALVSTSLVLIAVTAICFIAQFSFLGGWGSGGIAVGAQGVGQLATYLVIVGLACLGYGAVFLMVGLLLRNPVVPALALWLWEAANPVLPGLLKRISITFYLQSLYPVRPPEGPLALIVEPVSPWLGVPGLVLFTGLILVLSGLRIRRMEVAYSSD
jgi:ABC-type transport system involved in multi-copper enzyme maturation permease subunit